MIDDHNLHERQATFNHAGATPAAGWPQPDLKRYRAKIFKSGNSLALRLPKALGLKEGTEMLITLDNGRYALEPVEAPRQTIDISGFWGKAKGLQVPERRDFDERPSTVAARKVALDASKA